MSLEADLIITNAHIFTADEKKPFAEAIAIKGDRIIFVGSKSDVKRHFGPLTRIVDGLENTVMPGFIDSHFHILHGALSLDGMQFEDVTTYEQVVQVIKAYALEYSGEWLVGRQMNYTTGPGHNSLTRQDLDSIVSDRPIYIQGFDVHTAWANTLALKKAGIFSGANCGANSEVILDNNGEATGELREPDAFNHILNIIPQPSKAHKRELLRQAMRLTSQFGITSAHNMNNDEEQAVILMEMEQSNELELNLYMSYDIKPGGLPRNLSQEITNMGRYYCGDMLRPGCAKIFFDGVVETYTALLAEEYADSPGTFGASNYDLADFNNIVIEADRLGLQISTHAVGDLAVRLVLDAYELAQQINGYRDRRHRIEHIEIVHPQDLPRFKKLGVVASMQPLHAPLRIDDGDIWQWRVGEKRWPFSFAWSLIRDTGAALVFGSDWPVASQNPILGIYGTQIRQSWSDGIPNHRQTLVNALLSYTRYAAYAEFQEHQKGQIKPGYLADITVLSKDLFQADPEELKDVKPLMTLLRGKVIYEA